MRIYIDEAGNFLPPTSRPYSFSLVLALVIPSACEDALFYDFLRVRDLWPAQQVEVKGSALDEQQASEIIELVDKYDVLIEFIGIDTATHSDDVVCDFKTRQGDALTQNLSPEHHPDVVNALTNLRRSLREMPNQLFLQAFLTWELIWKTIQAATLYYVQRQPPELGDIAWIVDRKNPSLTEMERTWRSLILPLTENRSAKEPLGRLVGADYSYFSRYELDPNDLETARHVAWLRAKFGIAAKDSGYIDARRLYSERLDFADSRNSLGLQLADMLASTLRRALNGKLRLEGWWNLGNLLVRTSDTRLIQLGRAESSAEVLHDPHLRNIWNRVLLGNKNMLVD